ncbi:MAG TPA: polysaccharide biosynthesis C-terminal domain-containing protein, partial [Roseiflexaceae bacterium]|nr:polysaccharide biosynthesis C-terminal domain-containing protein [Roseiflexaceae bacterium]
IWYLPLSYLNGVTQYVIIAMRRQHSITVAFAIAAVFNLCANLLLIPRFGYDAAAALTIATEFVILLSFVRVLHHEGVLLPFGELSWRPVVAALVMGAAMLALHPFGWLAAAAVAPFVYGAALYVLGAFGAEERALARRVLGKGA